MFNKNIKKFLLAGLISLFGFFFFLASPNISLASDHGLAETISGGNLSGALNTGKVGSNPGTFLSSRAGILIGALLSFIGVIFMVLIIYSGLLWMTAQGNEQQVKKAQNLIVQAAIGLIIILSAYAITAFIGRQLTETNPVSTPANQSQESNIEGSSNTP